MKNYNSKKDKTIIKLMKAGNAMQLLPLELTVMKMQRKSTS
jgi:hypothetical protein